MIIQSLDWYDFVALSIVQHSFLGPSSSSSNQPRLDRSPAPVADDVPDAEGDGMVPVDASN